MQKIVGSTWRIRSHHIYIQLCFEWLKLMAKKLLRRLHSPHTEINHDADDKYWSDIQNLSYKPSYLILCKAVEE